MESLCCWKVARTAVLAHETVSWCRDKYTKYCLTAARRGSSILRFLTWHAVRSSIQTTPE